MKVNEFNETPGLSGKMGKAIGLFEMYRNTKEEKWKQQAEDLLEAVWVDCHASISFSYSEGLCGIGAGVEYLIQQQFVEGNADEILMEIDSIVIDLINSRPPLEANIEHGLLGLVCYLYQRLHYRIDSEEDTPLILKEYTIYLIDWIAESMQNEGVEKNYDEFFFVLVLLHQLCLFNTKVERLLKWCDKHR